MSSRGSGSPNARDCISGQTQPMVESANWASTLEVRRPFMCVARGQSVERVANMGMLVAIGGGEMAERETLAIDREIVSLTGRDRPNALFIPTASGDSPEYWQSFQDVYGQELGCATDVLYLLGVNPTKADLERKILSADLVYVGGGNTLKMMRRWRRLGVDSVLSEAYRRGIVLSGLSAGCICWFSWGHSDSMAFYRPDNWRWIRVRGMGLIDALVCPHFDGESLGVKRREAFQQNVRKHSGVGVAIEDNCALEVVDGMYRLITSKVGAGAYKLLSKGGKLTTQRIVQEEEYEPIALLLARAV